MSTERKGVEFFVGLFLLFGLAIIAAMVLIFGRLGQGFNKVYTISVEFPNASGLVKGCDVLLSGARVGVVSRPPRLIGRAYAVAADLAINEGVEIPRKSVFMIRSNGMLGDSYVDVIPPMKFTPGDFLAAGENATGAKAGGLDELTAKGGVLMDTLNEEVLRKINAELDELKTATHSVNENLLNEKNLKNLEEAFANLKTATAEFSQVSKNFDSVITKTSATVDGANNAFKTVDGAAGDLRLAITDVRKMTDSARVLVNRATNGEGPLGMLVSDRQTAENLKALIANLRRSGVFFYKDRPATPVATPAPPPPPRRR